MIYGHDPASGLHPVPNTLIGESATTLYGIGFWADGTGTKEFDGVVLMWMRTFTFAYLPLVPTEDIRITDIDFGTVDVQIQSTTTPAHSNFTLQANSSLSDPFGWMS